MMGRKNLRRCDAETLAKDVSGKVFVVTGANSGVGLETTRQLVRQGGHVVMACRRVEAGEEEARSFAGLKGTYEVMQLDLAHLQSVRDFVEAFRKGHDRLDGLMCNAGLVVMGNRARFTQDGLEETAAVSFFGHLLLTELLLDVIRQSAPSRIGMVSSVVHAGSPANRPRVHLDDLSYRNRKYNAFAAYAEAKVASVLYAMELGERLQGTGVTTASIHPGWARSNFGGNGLLMKALRVLTFPLRPFLTDSNEESAQTSLHVLLSDDAPNHSGAYFSQSSVLYRDKDCRDGGWPMASPNPNAKEMETAKKLVATGCEIVGLKQA